MWSTDNLRVSMTSDHKTEHKSVGKTIYIYIYVSLFCCILTAGIKQKATIDMEHWQSRGKYDQRSQDIS